MIPSDRMSFACDLRAALAVPEPVQGVNDLLRRVLTSEFATWESDEQRLVREIAERLDTASGEATRLLVLARDVGILLDQASSNLGVERLLELIAERHRVLVVLRKYAEGTISRTSFLSFIAEQQWPELVRRRMAELSTSEIANVMQALAQSDISKLEDIFNAHA